MSHFTSGGARWRPTVGAFLMALLGLSTLAMPRGSEATSDPCGRVYLVNTDNELLQLRRSAELLAREGESARDRNRRLDIRARKPITGLADGESLIGVDFRPSNGLLYGVGRFGRDPMALGQLYTIDVETGAAAAVGARLIPLNGSAFGVDFNPVPDLIRIVSDLGQNLRIRPADGTVAGTDTTLAYPAMGDPNSTRTPRVVAVAYTNPDVDLQTNTVLHDLDVDRAADADPARIGEVLAIQVPPNGGVLNTVGRLGIDADDSTAFDIGFDSEALAAIAPAGSGVSRLYFIDLASGDATDLGQIGRGELIVGLAIQVGPVCTMP
ncbi:MAG: DUF4394 domain-containing protein [Candidatus Rokuibacteriota bacterium]